MSRDQAQHLVDRVEILDPGIYTADSNTDGYGSLMAALDIGGAKFLGEELVSNDVRSVAIEVPEGAKARLNPDVEEFTSEHVQIGDSFYTRALKEYDPVGRCLIRELLQNSVDAGARVNSPKGVRTQIEISLENHADGTQTLIFEDNSGGMTLDILKNKFLTVSESGKRGEPSSSGSAGGFGIAKELILFPWLGYEVHTQDIQLKGVQGKFGTKKAAFLNGTKITLKLPSDYKLSESDVLFVVETSDLRQVRFRLNGETIQAHLRMEDSDEVQHFEGHGKMRLFYKPKARKTTGFFVRKTVCDPTGTYCGSLFMFSKGIESTIPGCFCLDITGSSLDTMFANRMGLKYPWSGELETYLRSLVKDKHNATRKKNNAMHREWTGASSYKPKAEAAGELAAIMSQFIGATDKFNETTNVEGIREILRKNEEEARKDEPPPSQGTDGPQKDEEPEETEEEKEDAKEDGGIVAKPVYTTAPDLVDIISQLPVIKEAAPGTISNTIKHYALRYNFYIHNEIEGCSCAHSRERHRTSGRTAGACYDCECEKYTGFRVPRRFMPEVDGRPTMSNTLWKISRFWGETCRAILIAANKGYKEFGIGWMFDTEFRDGGYKTTEGEYIRANGKNWLLLNPFRGGNIQDGKLFRLRDDGDLAWIFAIAVHECSHLTYGENGHDEGYARELTEMIAKSKHVGKLLHQIRDMVVKRPADWKPKPKAPPKPKKIRFKEPLESDIVGAMKEYKKNGYDRFGVSTSTGNVEVWRLDQNFASQQGSSYGGREYVIQRDTVTVFQLRKESGKEKEQLAEIESALRLSLANRYPEKIAKEVTDEDLESDLVELERELERSATENAPTYFDVRRLTGDNKKYTVVVSTWHGGNEYNWELRIDGSLKATSTVKGPKQGSGDWAKKVARAVTKAVGPILQEHWRT